MKIVIGYPPNIKAVRKVFPLTGGEIFAWGDTIYNPGGGALTPWLIEHEEVHQKQQGDDIDGWWARYLIDPAWRLEQEMEAHQVEYRSYCSHHKDRNQQMRYAAMIARRLSSPMYGKIVTYREALRRVRL